jgi:hypothetical protein
MSAMKNPSVKTAIRRNESHPVNSDRKMAQDGCVASHEKKAISPQQSARSQPRPRELGNLVIS